MTLCWNILFHKMVRILYWARITLITRLSELDGLCPPPPTSNLNYPWVKKKFRWTSWISDLAKTVYSPTTLTKMKPSHGDPSLTRTQGVSLLLLCQVCSAVWWCSSSCDDYFVISRLMATKGHVCLCSEKFSC